ncbi:hypothetical protein GCM10009670_01640 [Citricoccus alkalitolerans]
MAGPPRSAGAAHGTGLSRSRGARRLHRALRRGRLGTRRFLWGAGFAQGEDFARPDSAWDYNAYLGANTLAAGFAGVATLAFWSLWHRRRTGGA